MSSERVVAIGDVHGELDGLMTILHAAGLIDTSGRWSGGSATLVQTGDLVERGTRVREVLDLMMSLQEQAAEVGGRVIALLGNHDVGVLLGYLDYDSTPPDVYAQVFAGFTDEKSEERRQRALKRWNKWRRLFPQCGRQSKEEWEAAHPPGFVEFFEAVGPDGRHGRWLRSLPTIAVVGRTMFGHAGPSPWLAEQGINTPYSLNRAVTREIEAFDRVRAELIKDDIILPFFTLSEVHCAVTEELVRPRSNHRIPLSKRERARLFEIRESLPNVDTSLALHPEGPLWYRGYARLSDEEGPAVVEDLLDRWQVDDVVVAHTPQKGEVKRRFGSVYLIDTAMVFGPRAGGRPAALEIAGGRFAALYSGEEKLLAEREPAVESPSRTGGRWLAADGTPLPFAEEAEVEEFLRTANVLSSEEIPAGANKPRKLLIEQYGIRAHAIFRRYSAEERYKKLSTGGIVRSFSDSYRNEVAAYQLSRLLGIDNVHPAVPRTVDHADGSIQLWVEEVISEEERIERDLHPPNLEQWQRQAADMRIFDNLINNFDRNKGNVLVDSDWKLWLVDHTQSFGLEPSLPEPEKVERCSRRLWTRINALDEKIVRERLEPHLSRHEVTALFKRRDKLVELIRKRITEVGEEKVLFGTAADLSLAQEASGQT